MNKTTETHTLAGGGFLPVVFPEDKAGKGSCELSHRPLHGRSTHAGGAAQLLGQVLDGDANFLP